MSLLEPHLEQLLNPIERLRMCSISNILVCGVAPSCLFFLAPHVCSVPDHPAPPVFLRLLQRVQELDAVDESDMGGVRDPLQSPLHFLHMRLFLSTCDVSAGVAAHGFVTPFFNSFCQLFGVLMA